METIELSAAMAAVLKDNANPASLIGLNGSDLTKSTMAQISSVVGGLKYIGDVGADADFDTFVDTGIYTINEGKGNNNPGGMEWCMMVVFKSPYDVVQFALSEGYFKYRRKHDNLWGKWFTISMS